MMNDLYLFRGRRSDKKGWVVGDLNMPNGVKPYILPRDLDYDFMIGEHEVDPSTIGQCTGLIDKNGVLIFEGDILYDDDYESIVVVYWSNIYSAWQIEFPTDGEREFLAELCWKKDDSSIADTAKIIGNLHDNPELLGEIK